MSDEESAAEFGQRLSNAFMQNMEQRRQEEREAAVPREHVLKTWRAPFDGVWTGAKPYEFRQNDRSYQVGDVLYLCEWDESCERCGSRPPGTCDDRCVPRGFLGRAIKARVTYMTKGPDFGVPSGYCVLGIRPMLAYSDLPKGKLPAASDFA